MTATATTTTTAPTDSRYRCQWCERPTVQRPDETRDAYRRRAYCSDTCLRAGRRVALSGPRDREYNTPQPRPVLTQLIGMRSDANCAGSDSDLWTSEHRYQQIVARQICRGADGHPVCPLITLCVAAAIEGNEHGIWGGTSHQERQRLRRRLKGTAR